MPLGLHPDCRKRLNEALIDALRSVQTKNGMFIERSSTAKIIVSDLILPRTGKLHERLVEYLDEFPFTDFVLETLGQELWELDRFLADQTIALTDIAEYQDPTVTATRILDTFESLPWTYQTTILLPETLNDLLLPGQSELSISDTIRIVRPDDTFLEQYPLAHDNQQRQQRMKGGIGLLSLLDSEPAKWQADRLYLQISADGFIGQYGSTLTAKNIERTLRAFCGLGIATRLFAYQYSYSLSASKPAVHVHRKRPDGSWEPQTRYELDDAFSRGLAAVKIHDLDGHLDTQDKKRAWIYYRLQDMGAVFQSGQRGDPIVLASRWLFDSHTGQDQLLSFIQSMVVLEIILGDKSISDEIGIGELISNRFAYLIGTTHQERFDLLATFKKIYRVRSQIVHSGKHKLTLDERALFLRLRWMCRRVIDKEVDLLKAGIAAQKPKPEDK